MRWFYGLAGVLALCGSSCVWAGDCPAEAAKSGVLALTRADGTPDGEIAVERPRVDTAWLLRNCSDKKVGVTLPPVELHGPNGTKHALEWSEGGPFDLPRLDARLLRLRSATDVLLAPGMHTAIIRAEPNLSGWAPLVTALRVKFVPVKPAEAIASAPVTSYYAELGFGPQSIPYPIRVRRNEGGGWPTLRAESITRKDADDAKVVEPLDAPAPAASAAAGSDGTAVYTLSFQNVGGPGRYDGQLRVQQPGYADVTAPLTFYVKACAAVAFLFILLGVVASYVMSLYGMVWRPRLATRQRIGAIVDKLRAAEVAAQGDADTTALVRGVRAGLEAAWNDARSRRTALDEATTTLYANIAQALQAWPGTVSRLKGLRPASVGQTLLDELRAHGEALLTAKPDATKVKAALDALAAMPETARAKANEELQAAITKLDQLLSGATGAGLVSARAQAVRAQSLLTAKRFDDALAAYDAAVLQYADHYAAVFRALADPAKPQPVGVDAKDWKDICAGTRAELDAVAASRTGEERLRGVQQAARVYLLNCAASLRGYAARQHANKLPAIEPLLANLEKALGEGDVAKAIAQFDAAATLLAGPTGGIMGAVGASDTAALAFDAVAVFDLPSSWDSVSRSGAAAGAEASIESYDIQLSALVLIVASLAGIGAVWSKDPAWGGPGAYLGAFLFGLAADQFTKSGIAALRGLKP